jgi:hypothetical protein
MPPSALRQTMIATGQAAWTVGCGTLVGVKEGQADGQFVLLPF